MLSSLLVPTDGSPIAERAIPLAAAIARHTGAHVHLVSVMDPTAFLSLSMTDARAAAFEAPPVQERFRAERERVEGEAERLRASGIATTAHTPDGTVVGCLLETARDVGADCVVMATHGRSGFARMRLGSIATAVLARSAIPVLLVPDGAESTELAAGPLLVPLDGEPYAEAVLPSACAFGEALGHPLALLAVVAPRALPMAPLGIEALAEVPEAGRDVAAYLATVSQRCPAGTTTQVSTATDIDQGIVAEAERIDAALIAMASHARGGFARLLQPSVTDAVVRASRRPVLVYHPGE